jgi:RNA polymerase sigma factor (sigma-70 family)
MTKNNQAGKAKAPKSLSAVTRAFMENSTFLYAFLRRFLRRQQDIEDVAQEAYLKAYTTEQSRDIDHPKTYLFTIAKNIAINELTRETNKIVGYIEECKSVPAMESSATVENELEAQQSLGAYCDAVAALPEKCRRVFLLRRVHGLKQQEIADSLGISLRMVEKHLRMGTLKCRAYMNETLQSDALGLGSKQTSAVPREGRDQ